MSRNSGKPHPSVREARPIDDLAAGLARPSWSAGLDVHVAVANRPQSELARSATVPPAVLEMISDGRLGCKTGRGLRGDYSAGVVTRIEAARDWALLALSALRGRERT